MLCVCGAGSRGAGGGTQVAAAHPNFANCESGDRAQGDRTQRREGGDPQNVRPGLERWFRSFRSFFLLFTPTPDLLWFHCDVTGGRFLELRPAELWRCTQCK